MPLGAADLTRIYKYRAFTLGNSAGDSLTYNEVMDLIQQQINAINATDTARGTTFADQIQADLTRLDTLDTTLNTSASDGAMIRLDVIEWAPGKRNEGYREEFTRLTQRIARVLSQSYADSDHNGINYAYRG